MPLLWRAPAWASQRTATHNLMGYRPVPNISRAVATKLSEEFKAGPLSQQTANESMTGSRAAIALVRSQARWSTPLFPADSAPERCAWCRESMTPAVDQCRVELTTGCVPSCGRGVMLARHQAHLSVA